MSNLKRIGLRMHKSKMVLVNLDDDVDDDAIIMTVGHANSIYDQKTRNKYAAEIVSRFNEMNFTITKK